MSCAPPRFGRAAPSSVGVWRETAMSLLDGVLVVAVVILAAVVVVALVVGLRAIRSLGPVRGGAQDPDDHTPWRRPAEVAESQAELRERHSALTSAAAEAGSAVEQARALAAGA